MASVEIEDGEVRLTALKNGRTRVAVSGADKKVKAALRVIVGANAVTLRKDAPRAAEIAAVSDARPGRFARFPRR